MLQFTQNFLNNVNEHVLTSHNVLNIFGCILRMQCLGSNYCDYYAQIVILMITDL